MALFTKRDRIAIAVIAALILVGWGFRYGMGNRQKHDDLRIFRNAVEPPPFFTGSDSTAVSEESSSHMVNINIAGPADLKSLPGIAEVRAANIVKYREKNGPFKRPEDIMNVPGIGKGIFRQLADRITVGEGSEVTEEP
ncbi:ComEA family DNA-binding protein [Candidatus Latescibacterota bacterium]